jgi:transcriptional regulator with XRE-family HTH domain
MSPRGIPAPLPPLPPEAPDEPARLRLARRAHALRADGLLLREVAEALGVSRAYVGDLLRDPTGRENRARHERARGACVDCGRPTAWGGAGGPPERCVDCDLKHRAVTAAPCGTRGAYARGCRCDACREACNAYARERFRRRYRSDPEFRQRVLERNRQAAAARREAVQA